MTTRQTVLVADDEAPVRATLTKFLRSIGIEEVVEATNGREAVERVKAAPHLNLVLIDLKMPVQDGLKALEEIRTFNQQVKVVVLTGYPFYGEADQTAHRLGIFDFIVKPVDLDYLERVVSLALSNSPPPQKPAA